MTGSGMPGLPGATGLPGVLGALAGTGGVAEPAAAAVPGQGAPKAGAKHAGATGAGEGLFAALLAASLTTTANVVAARPAPEASGEAGVAGPEVGAARETPATAEVPAGGRGEAAVAGEARPGAASAAAPATVGKAGDAVPQAGVVPAGPIPTESRLDQVCASAQGGAETGERPEGVSVPDVDGAGAAPTPVAAVPAEEQGAPAVMAAAAQQPAGVEPATGEAAVKPDGQPEVPTEDLPPMPVEKVSGREPAVEESLSADAPKEQPSEADLGGRVVGEQPHARAAAAEEAETSVKRGASVTPETTMVKPETTMVKPETTMVKPETPVEQETSVKTETAGKPKVHTELETPRKAEAVAKAEVPVKTEAAGEREATAELEHPVEPEASSETEAPREVGTTGMEQLTAETPDTTQQASAAQSPASRLDVPAPEVHRSETHPAERAELRELPQIIRRAEVVARSEGPSEMRLQLVPEHLGRLQVRVSIDEGVVTARLVVENPEVKALVEQRLPELSRALQDQGLRLTNVSVGCENSGANRDFQGWQGERDLPLSLASGSARREYDDLPSGAVGLVHQAISHQWRGSGGVVDALV